MKRLLITLILIALILPAGVAETPSIAGQYYAYTFFAEGYGDYDFFFHFYEPDPVLGAVYYAGLSNNQIRFAGLYAVEEAPYDYACCADRAAATNADGKLLTTGTAPYTIRFYDWDGVEIDSCGWDGNILYNDCETIIGSGSGPMFYHLDAEGARRKAYEGELGVSYLDFVVIDDDTCTVSLCHDMSYVDMMVYYLDGDWKLSYNDAGEAVYALTPYDEYESGAVLTVSADKQSAVYQNADGDMYDMVNALATGRKLAYVGAGSAYMQSVSADATLELYMYDDNSCELIASVYGTSAVLDYGEYSINADNTISFDFDGAGALTATLNYEIPALSLNYVNESTQIGSLESALVISRYEAPVQRSLLFSFTGGFTTFDVYDDGTYEFGYEGAGLKETGVWAFENYAFSFTQSNGSIINAEMNDERALTFTYVAEANAQLKDTFTCDSAIWGAALVK